jgi:hypothetical protein
MLGHGVRCIFLTAPLSYAAVALSFGQYEKRLRHENSQPVTGETLECVFFVLHLLNVGSK